MTGIRDSAQPSLCMSMDSILNERRKGGYGSAEISLDRSTGPPSGQAFVRSGETGADGHQHRAAPDNKTKPQLAFHSKDSP